jgi:hypothetical protein
MLNRFFKLTAAGMPGKRMRPRLKTEAGAEEERGESPQGARAAAAAADAADDAAAAADAAATAAAGGAEEVPQQRRRRVLGAGVSRTDTEELTELQTLRGLTQAQALHIHDMERRIGFKDSRLRELEQQLTQSMAAADRDARQSRLQIEKLIEEKSSAMDLLQLELQRASHALCVARTANHDALKKKDAEISFLLSELQQQMDSGGYAVQSRALGESVARNAQGCLIAAPLLLVTGF